MSDWAVDSSGIRRAHAKCILGRIAAPQRLHLSPLTWLPAGAPFAPAMRPELRYPDPGAGPPVTPSRFGPAPHTTVSLCDALEDLYDRNTVVLADSDKCATSRLIEVEQAWKSAAGLSRLMDESIAAVLVAEANELPLISADPSVLRLSRHRGLDALTVEEFAAKLAA